MRLATLAAVALSGNVMAAVPGELPVWARGGKIYKDMERRKLASGILTNSTANYYEQQVDHTDPSKGTFRQRYYVDYSYYNLQQPSHTAFLYIGGEGPLNGSPGGYTAVVAQNQSALIVALEHRWYGASVPGDITSTADLETLVVDQVMADISGFITYYNTLPDGPFHWLTIGGSYPGALSAWFREKHPELTVGAWSSSGVVDAVYNFTEFDMIVATALGPDCADAVRKVTASFEAAWSDPTRRSNMIKLFNSAEDFTKGDFAWMLADSAAMGSQYGYKEDLCSYLVPTPPDVLAAFADWTNTHYGTSFGSSCYYSTACLSDVSRVAQWYNVKTWIWQCCREVAYWQIAYPNSLRSDVITIDYFQDQCAAAFGMPMVADTAAFNAKYGGFTPDATEVYASNGSDDPWQGASVNQTLGPTYPEYTAVCDGCGHCGDLHAPSSSDPEVIRIQRQQIMDYVAQWVAKGKRTDATA